MLECRVIEAPIGALLLRASSKGLQSIQFFASMGEAQVSVKPLDLQCHGDAVHAILKQAEKEITAYFAGALTVWQCPLDVAGGTDLQQRVWREIARVPHGQTISYSTLAERVRKPGAVRAVASACGKNPLPIIIPCHRILAKNGGLGGFAWGLKAKKFLLELETRHAPEQRAA